MLTLRAGIWEALGNTMLVSSCMASPPVKLTMPPLVVCMYNRHETST